MDGASGKAIASDCFMENRDVPPVISTPAGARIRYSLNRWDFLRFQLWSILHNRFLLGFFIIMDGFLIWLTLRGPEMAARSIGGKVSFAIGFTLFAAVLLGVFEVLVLGLRILLQKGHGQLGEHELEIRADGIAERTTVNESLHRWSGYHRTASSGPYLYLFVTDGLVHIIPKRAFGSKQNEMAFRKEIEQRVAAVKHTQTD